MNSLAQIHRLPRALEECIIIDVETTGLEPKNHRIIEVATLTVRDAQPINSQRWLLNPEDHISEFITDLTGITNAHVAKCPTFRSVAEEIMSVLNPAGEHGSDTGQAPILVGHNVAFDYSFLQHELLRNELHSPINDTHGAGREQRRAPYTPPLLCTAEIARTLIPRSAVGRYRLANVAAYFDAPHRPQHRADVDVWATFDVLCGLAAIAEGGPA